MWLTCIDCLQQKLYSETYPVSVELLYILCLLNEKQKISTLEVFGLVIYEEMKGSNRGKKMKTKNLENVIHYCRCNGQKCQS